MSSFNLLGCDKVTKIINLQNTSVSAFTGSHFVAGCRNLTEFENCNLTFTNLTRSFKMTEALTSVPDEFQFNISNGASCVAAFSDTGINIGDLFARLGPLTINASNMFIGSEIT